MEIETNSPGAHDSVMALHRLVAVMMRDGLITPDAASDVQRALERALTESREDRLAIVALLDALLHALDRELLSADVFEIDETEDIARFHLVGVIAELVRMELLNRRTWTRLRRVLRSVETWFPEAGIRGVRQRLRLAGRRHRGFEVHLGKGREFIKRMGAVPLR